MFWSGRGFGRGIWAERISPVEFLMLLLLNEEPTHGYDMMQRLTEKFSGLWSPKPGTVYPALSRLDEKGLIKIKEAETEGEEKAGEAASDALTFTLREIATEIAQDDSVKQLLKGQ
jgi:DNA-binding PadR family transcriptional regulator